ncbi:MAG: MFS transporter [Thermoprotei archaeon]
MIRARYNSMNSRLIVAAILVVLITFALRASNNMMVTTVPLIGRYDFGMGAAEVGLLASSSSLASFAATLYNSRLCARKRRFYFITASVAFAITLPLFSFATPVTLWVLYIIAGFLMGFLMPNIITSAGLYSDPGVRERMLAIYTLALSTSLVFGPSLEGIILLRFSLKQVFLLFLPLALVVVAVSPTIKFPESEKNAKADPKQVIKNPYFLTAVFNNLAYNIPFAMLTAFGGIYARGFFKASYSQVELLFALFFSTSFLVRLLLSLRRFSRLITITYLSVSLTLVGLMLMVFSPNFLTLALAFLVLGFPHGFTFPVSLIYIGRGFDESSRNAANSLFFSIMTVTGIVVPSGAGIFIDLLGYRMSFAALVMPVAILLILVWWNSRRIK